MKKICLLLSCLFVVLLLLSGPLAAQPVDLSKLTAYGDNTLSFDIAWGPAGGRVTPWSDSVWVLIDYTDPVSKELKRLFISGATVTAGQTSWPLAKARMVDGNSSGFFVDGQARAVGTAATLTLRVTPQAGVTISKPCVYALDYPPLATYGMDGSMNTVELVGTEPFCGIIVNSSGGTMTFPSSEASWTLPAGFRVGSYTDLSGNSGVVDCAGALPTVTGSSGAARCASGVVTLLATPSAGATIDWYSAATGGTLLLSGNTAYSPSVASNTTYYAQARNTGTQCTSAVRTAVAATVSAIPTVTVSSSQTVCFNEAPAALTATSSGGHGSPQVYTWQRSTDGSNWTTVSGSTNTYAPGASTVTNYYRAQVTQTTTGCTSGYSDPATITAKYCDGPTDSNCSYRTLTIGTTTWAGCNSTYTTASGTGGQWVFAARPDTYTPFVQWNKATVAWPATATGDVSTWSSGTSSAATWAMHPCPGGWRLPTEVEYEALNAQSVWAEAGVKGNSVAGRFYGPATATCTISTLTNCVFLPAVGYRFGDNGTLDAHGIYGDYWASREFDQSSGYSFGFLDATSIVFNFDKAGGFSARCVRCDVADCGLPPVITASKGDARCSSSGVVSLTATPSADATIDWYSAASGGTLLHAGSTVYEPSITAATTYYAEARHNSTGRLSTNRTAVVATMYPTFTPGAIAANGQTLCAGATPAAINSTTAASGGDGVITYSWYKNGTLIAGATAANYTPPAADAAANTATSTLTITYTRRAKDNTCNTTPVVSAGTWNMGVLRTPAKPTLSAGTLTVCSGATTTISLPDWYGLPNVTERNYHIPGIVWARTANVGAGTYNGQVQSPEGCWSAYSDVITITAISCTGGGCDYPVLQVGTTTWAGCNSTYTTASGTGGQWVFADRPDTYTPFVQWNKPSVAWSATATGAMTNWTSGTSTADGWSNGYPCPSGWRLPTNTEFQALHNAGTQWSEAGANGNTVAGRFYGSSYTSCSLPTPVNCIFLPAAFVRDASDGTLLNESSRGYYWSSVQSDITLGYRLFLSSSNSVATTGSNKAIGCSARCVRCDDANCGPTPEPPNPDPSACTTTTGSMQTVAQSSINAMTTGQTVCLKDARDDKTYRAVKMPDGRLWMAQNLNFTGYTDKSVTLTYATTAASPRLGTPGTYAIGYYWCYNSAAACDTYGALYAWETAMSRDGVYGGAGTGTGPNSWKEPTLYCSTGPCSNNANVEGRGICPPNWHVPTDAEWGTLLKSIDGNSAHTSGTGTIGTAGNVSRSTQRGTATALNPLWSGTRVSSNTTGFNVFPGGRRYQDASGGFNGLGSNALFWSSSLINSGSPWYRKWLYDSDGIERKMYYLRGDGVSVRCLRD